MKTHLAATICLALASIPFAIAQDSSSVPPPPPMNQGPAPGGRGPWDGPGGGMGRGLTGAVTEIASDHALIKTDAGEVYTIHIGADTRVMKQVATMQAPGNSGPNPGGEPGRGFPGNPPQQIQLTEIKTGDTISVMGPVDASAKSATAQRILLLDPMVVKQMQEMRANYGKTWLQGKVTSIDGVTITLLGMIDNVPHTVVADENTAFRKHREPVTLADLQVGDMVRVDGAVTGGIFTATSVNIAGMRGGEGPMLPRYPPPQ